MNQQESEPSMFCISCFYFILYGNGKGNRNMYFVGRKLFLPLVVYFFVRKEHPFSE